MLSFHRSILWSAALAVPFAVAAARPSTALTIASPSLRIEPSSVVEEPGIIDKVEGPAVVGTVAFVTVTLSPPQSEPLRLRFFTARPIESVSLSQATPDVDFEPFAFEVVLAPGETQAGFGVNVLDDDMDESTEGIVVVASLVEAPGVQALGRIDIIDDDAPPIAVPDVGFVNEEPGAVVHVPVKLQGSSAFDIWIDWRTVNVPDAPAGQALAPGDYAAASGTLRIPAGRRTGVIDVSIVGDRLFPEPDEFIVVSFSNPTNATLGGFFGLGFGVILDVGPRVVTAVPRQ